MYDARRCTGHNSEPHGIGLVNWPNAYIFIMDATNQSRAAVAQCCYPNILNIADGCTMWCILPSRHIEKGENTKGLTPIRVMSDCIGERSSNRTNPSALRSPSGAADREHMRAKAFGLWALLVVGHLVV